MIKKILAISCIFCLVLGSFVFAEDTDNVYYANKTSGRTSNGVIYAPGVKLEGSTSNNIVEEQTTQEQDNNNTTILAELYRKLAILRGEIPADEVQVAANPVIVNNTDIASGYNNGIAYGLARLGQIMGKRKEAEVTFVGANKVGEYSYIAEFKSSDVYCNGKFQIDLIGDGENKMDGYQWAFGIYDVNKKKIGNAQAKKVW